MDRWLKLVGDSVAQGIGWTFGIIAALWVCIAIGAWPQL